MGFTTLLMLIYLALLVLDGFAFAAGRRYNNWVGFIAITSVMALGIAVLGYLWVTSPM